MPKLNCELSEQFPLWPQSSETIQLKELYFSELAEKQICGAGWDAWRGQALNVLKANQVFEDGPLFGSWKPVDYWNSELNPYYTTVMCLLIYATCLE